MSESVIIGAIIGVALGKLAMPFIEDWQRNRRERNQKFTPAEPGRNYIQVFKTPAKLLDIYADPRE